jgi:hypothetical protein
MEGFMEGLHYKVLYGNGKSRLTSACTRLPTALFFKGYAPAKTPLVGSSLAGPVAGKTRR